MAESQNYKDIYEFADYESELDDDEFEADVPEAYEEPQSILRTLEARAKRKALPSERLKKKKHLCSPKSYTSKSSVSATKKFYSISSRTSSHGSPTVGSSPASPRNPESNSSTPKSRPMESCILCTAPKSRLSQTFKNMKSPSIQRSFSPIIASDTELEDLPSITTQDTPMETQDIPVQGFSGSSNTSESSIQMTMLANISSTLNDVVK